MGFKSFFAGKATVEKASNEALRVSGLPDIAQIFGRLDQFPERSRKMLLPAPLQDESLLIGRDAELARLADALKSWQDGHPTSVVLVGPQGCGKTSLLNCFLNNHLQDQQRVLRCEIEERLVNETHVLDFFRRLFQIDTPEDHPETLIELLLQTEPRTIMVEGGHNVLLRVIGGSKAAEVFLYTLLCTRRQHFWLLTCRRQPWNNMERQLGASRYFSHVIAVDLLSDDSMREALTLRLKNCGLPVTYCLSEEDCEACREHQARQQRTTEDDFNRALLANSGRNFHAALYFLLLCSRYEAINQSLFLWPPDRLDMAFLKEMDRLHLLTLAELAGHGVLSVREHALIFRTSAIESRMVFEYLAQLKLVLPVSDRSEGADTAYELSPVIHHAATSALEQLNLLY